MRASCLIGCLLLVAVVPVSVRAGNGPGLGHDSIRFGVPAVESVSVSEIVVAVPVSIRPVGVEGTIERVAFYGMKLNGVPFEVLPVDESFELPRNEPASLPTPLRLRARFADVAPGLVREALLPSDTLRLTGTLSVAGTFRKWKFSFKRTAEIPIDESTDNPIAAYRPLDRILEQLDRFRACRWKLPF